jgi:hypothetical protein
MSFETPIAFFVFDRPSTTQRVFEALAEVRPARLLVVGDGPRPDRDGEAERVARTREILQRVDWPCDVRSNFSPHNLGCRRRVSSGLEWVFSLVEEAILLEDDCLPHPSFFPYARDLLARFRDDRRIMAIAGANFLPPGWPHGASYYFSKHFHCWGWATWRRAWRHYDVALRTWPEFRDSGALRSVTGSPEEESHWQRVFDAVHRGEIDTWDYQWQYATWSQHGLTVLPSVNLVSNIGFGAAATHTVDPLSRWANVPTSALGELRHPAFVVPDRQADEYTIRHNFNIRPLSRYRRFRKAVRRKLTEVGRRLAAIFGKGTGIRNA